MRAKGLEKLKRVEVITKSLPNYQLASQVQKSCSPLTLSFHFTGSYRTKFYRKCGASRHGQKINTVVYLINLEKEFNYLCLFCLKPSLVE